MQIATTNPSTKTDCSPTKRSKTKCLIQQVLQIYNRPTISQTSAEPFSFELLQTETMVLCLIDL